MAQLFGTDGVRGLANRDLTPELAFQLGRAAGALLKTPGKRASMVVGRDTRLSGPMLEGALTAGITSSGVDVFLAGVIPTPAIAYLARTMDCCAGAVISASHNPAPDNGIKFFNHKGFKLDDRLEEEIEGLVLGTMDHLPRPAGAELGRIEYLGDAGERYLDYLKKMVRVDFSGLRIALDCANGAAYSLAPRLLRDLGAEVITLNNEPDGLNINDHSGSTHPQSLQEAVVRLGADLGLAHDGDADRVIAVDEKGRLVNGDQILVICGLELQKQKELQDKIVVTVMSNLGLKLALERAGITVLETKVGDRFVLEKMQECGAVLGGEQSGHIIFLRHNTTGDGILTALKIIEVIKNTGLPLSQLANQMENFPQVLLNVRVKNKEGWEENERIHSRIKHGEEVLAQRGRLFVRASGTEPLIRVMAEGPDKGELESLTAAVAEVIREELG